MENLLQGLWGLSVVLLMAVPKCGGYLELNENQQLDTSETGGLGQTAQTPCHAKSRKMHIVAIQWRHMILVAFQITSNLTVCSITCWGNTRVLYYCTLWENPLVISGFSPQKASNADSVSRAYFIMWTKFITRVEVNFSLWTYVLLKVSCMCNVKSVYETGSNDSFLNEFD